MQAKIKKVVQETHDTKSFVLELEAPMTYKASQFVMVKINTEESVPPRAFSIACAPNNQREILITARIYAGGKFTPHLNLLKVGDSVEIKGPYGKFVYEPGQTTIIGAGTGIAPLRAIMHTALQDGQKTELFYSDKTEGDLIYKDEFEALANEGKIALHLFVTREPENKKYNTHRINKDFLEKNLSSKEGNFYVCGTPQFVPDMVDILTSLGISEEQIKHEKF